ncbi:unnamed protein product [Trichogramma brassicae]|uniref:Uncharacterized protein n=1 Tax=Trichogramma brassicae TaxID=86971 RepID=A0A6H5IZ85_9HYME|nr:unnamed protein product [Trichogramma brassicae]
MEPVKLIDTLGETILVLMYAIQPEQKSDLLAYVRAVAVGLTGLQTRQPRKDLILTKTSYDAGVMRREPSTDCDVLNINMMLQGVSQLKPSGHPFEQSNLREWRTRREGVIEGRYQESPMTGKAENHCPVHLEHAKHK